MALQFTPDLSTTVAEIDNQHQELFKRVDSLLTALQGGKGGEELVKTIQFLTDYVVFHFGVEEKYMDTYRYVDRAQHKAQHAQFVKTFLRLRDRLLAEGINAETTEDAKQLVVDWLINHIKYSDRGLGLFLKRKLPA
jgi:hemerythrin